MSHNPKSPCGHFDPSQNLGCKYCKTALYKESRYLRAWFPDYYANKLSPQVIPNPVWAYGITTVPSRYDSLFKNTLLSLQRAGFVKPHLFIDGLRCGENLYENLINEYGLEYTIRYPAVGVAKNFILSLYELYCRSPHATLYALFQDDLLISKNAKTYIEEAGVPQDGYCNLYTFPVNQAQAPDRLGWIRSNQLGLGAVALLFPKPAVLELLASNHMIKRPQCKEKGDKGVDGGIVTSLNQAGISEYCHNPSIVQHMGDISTIGNRQHPKARNWLGEDFDLLDLVKGYKHAKSTQ